MIGILIFPDFQLLDAAGPISVFEVAARCAGKPLALRVLAVNAGPVRSSSGVEMVARDFKSANAITTLVIAGGGPAIEELTGFDEGPIQTIPLCTEPLR